MTLVVPTRPLSTSPSSRSSVSWYRVLKPEIKVLQLLVKLPKTCPLIVLVLTQTFLLILYLTFRFTSTPFQLILRRPTDPYPTIDTFTSLYLSRWVEYK